MPRPLAPDERALWSRVAATVRPLGARKPLKPAPLPAVTVRPSAPVPPKASRAALAAPVASATLDGGWDTRVRKGRMQPDRTLDLHGHTAASAHALLTGAVEAASHDGARVLLVVTGKGAGGEGKGVLRASLAHWLDAPGLRPYVAALRPAHPKHGGGGAWYVVLRRRR